jgi:signal transduction histidine kinase
MPAAITFATLIGPAAAPLRHVAGREKSLLDTVAHELRNPLTSLRLSLDMLIKDFDELEPQTAFSLVQRAQRSASWLQTLTDNLTSAACVETGHLDVQPHTIDLLHCFEQAVLLVRGLVEQRHQSVRVTSSASSTLVDADPARTVQVLANLLSNASRYSVEGDEIELHVSSVGYQLRVRVTDHGPGISPENQQRIFGAWVRVEGAAPGGLGLGLNIVQNLVEQQGGRVGVESTVGQGATFWFTLPTPIELGAVAACGL